MMADAGGIDGNVGGWLSALQMLTEIDKWFRHALLPGGGEFNRFQHSAGIRPGVPGILGPSQGLLWPSWSAVRPRGGVAMDSKAL